MASHLIRERRRTPAFSDALADREVVTHRARHTFFDGRVCVGWDLLRCLEQAIFMIVSHLEKPFLTGCLAEDHKFDEAK